MRNIWVYDIEQFKNFHCSTWLDIDTGEVKSFTLSIFNNDYQEYKDFVNSGIIGIGFNNLNYDYPLLDYLFNIVGNLPLEEMNDLLYKESQRLVNTETPKFNRIRNPIFSQIDVFSIAHFDNPARRTSLKQLEVALELPNVEDMPYHYTSTITKIEEQNKILEYNLNDVQATYQFFLKMVDNIRLRQNIKQNTNLDCINWSDSKLGEHLFLYYYCKETNENPQEVLQRRTNRDFVNLKDIIQHINFKQNHLKELQHELKKVVIYNSNDNKDSIENKVAFDVYIKELKLDVKKGGIHGSLKGVFKESSTHSIIDVDVASLYPSLYIDLEAVPEHLNKESFLKVAKSQVTWRKQNKSLIKSDKNAKIQSDTYKKALNSVYGKFKDKYSFLYDIACTFKVTINGQLRLLKLLEDISEIEDCQIIQANTDGITVYVNNNQIDNFRKICNQWESFFNMELEEVFYKAMFIRDVNNYFAITKENKYKYKGAYVPDLKSDSVPDPYHKDYSNQISVIAAINYFVNNISIRETITTCYDIKKFCLKERCNKKDKLVIQVYNGVSIQEEEVSRTVRFYVAKSYKKLKKVFEDGRISQIVSGFNVELINRLPDDFPTDIDFRYYIQEAQKLIDDIEQDYKSKNKKVNKNQLKLF